MARLTRLALAGHAHLIALQALVGLRLFVDDADREAFLRVLREAGQQHHVALHGYTLLDDQVYLLATPRVAEGLSLLVQSLGRRYVATYNRRRVRRGGLWDGRYRATILQPGAAVLDALVLIDSQALRAGLVTAPAEAVWSSARHHLGLLRDPLLATCDEYWRLGNTPFEREEAYRQRMLDGLGSRRVEQLTAAVHKGWAVGDDAFLAHLAEQTGRPVQPRPRGRPPKPLS
ncbi:transposase [Aquincola sp. S2]|uniref:Transposase n=1 Tax=Pseudaquabacterium terrae TaxID=2732868 RepID=A0ABX2ED16_9BURK|nr:transposase [Aquabacterium terrae]NRF66611.1 transposase [Aquabacterium terrae]